MAQHLSLASVSIFTKTPDATGAALLSKRISLDADGNLVADGSACRMARGSAISTNTPDAAALAAVIDALGPNAAIVLGTMKEGVGVRRDVVTKHAWSLLPETQRNTTITRSRGYVDYVAGSPGWLLVDFDGKSMPDPVRGIIADVGGVWQALLTVAPGLATAARVTRTSTSAGLSRADTGERLAGSGGEHHYVLVEDGGDIDRALRDLHDRCWLHGLGWHLVGAAGQLLERSIVDVAVRFGERLCFEGAPEVLPPLLQDGSVRAPQVFNGVASDTRRTIAPLSLHERGLVEDRKAHARRELEPAAHRVRTAVDNALIAELRKLHPEAIARRIVAQRHERNLLPDIVLDFDHFGLVRVGDVLADPERFEGETLCDPFEGESYGRGKAQIIRSRTGPLIIHSFAHGGIVYRLRHDLASAIATLGKAPKASALDVMCEIDAAASLEADEVGQVLAEAVRISGFGIRIVTKRLNDARKAREHANRKARAEAEAAADISNRLRRPAPPADGRRTEVVEAIDQALSSDSSERPPMRNRDRALVEVRTQALHTLHTLTAHGANAEVLPEGVEPLPAPPEPTLAMLTATEVELLVERYFFWLKLDKHGIETYPAALPSPFIHAFMEFPNSGIPMVHAVNTTPMVLADGSVLSGDGFNRETGIFHHIEPGLQACVPTGRSTDQDAREAVQWLFDEWLVDVLTDARGKLTAILFALTCIQRTLLTERPAFLIDAGKRGGGKTTLCNMIVMAVYGRRASATSWSPHEEERRKSLFAHLLAGVSVVIWDNIPTGAAINSAVINRSLTTETLGDRILGVSKHGNANATTVQAFTGNLISAAGDFTRRVRRVHLETDLTRPEDRAVKHQDPIGWTEANRRKILRCLYTLLIYAGQNRPKGQVPRTGMKQWWRLVGYAAEVAGPLLDPPVAFDCVEEDKALEVVDAEAETISTILRLVLQEFGTNEFAARDIDERIGHATNIDYSWAKNLDQAAIAAAKAVGTAFAEALEALAIRKISNLTPVVIGTLLATRVVDQGHYLDDARTISGSLKWRIVGNTKRFRLKVVGDPSSQNTHFSKDVSSDAPPFAPLAPSTQSCTTTREQPEIEGARGANAPQSDETGSEKTVFSDGPEQPPDGADAISPLTPAGASAPSPSLGEQARPRRGGTTEVIRATAAANPAWQPGRIARELGISEPKVIRALKGWSPPTPRQAEEQPA